MLPDCSRPLVASFGDHQSDRLRARQMLTARTATAVSQGKLGFGNASTSKLKSYPERSFRCLKRRNLRFAYSAAEAVRPVFR